MLARFKLNGVILPHNYHGKMAMKDTCEITGTKAITCLIKELLGELQKNVQTFKCNTSGELYSGFLSSFRQQGGPQDFENKSYVHLVVPRQSKRQDTKTESISHNCQEFWNHCSRNCNKPEAERCIKCSQHKLVPSLFWYLFLQKKSYLWWIYFMIFKLKFVTREYVAKYQAFYYPLSTTSKNAIKIS